MASVISPLGLRIAATTSSQFILLDCKRADPTSLRAVGATRHCSNRLARKTVTAKASQRTAPDARDRNTQSKSGQVVLEEDSEYGPTNPWDKDVSGEGSLAEADIAQPRTPAIGWAEETTRIGNPAHRRGQGEKARAGRPAIKWTIMSNMSDNSLESDEDYSGVSSEGARAQEDVAPPQVVSARENRSEEQEEKVRDEDDYSGPPAEGWVAEEDVAPVSKQSV